MHLAARQREALIAIYRLLMSRRVATFSALRAAMGVKSNYAIEDWLVALETRKLIIREIVDERDDAQRWLMRRIRLTSAGIREVPIKDRVETIKKAIMEKKR